MIDYTVVFFIFGAITGSFLNVCIYRIPRGMSIVFPSSHCPSCDSEVRFYDNIPIISYLVLRGRCRSCRTKISPVYPLVELLNATLYAFTFSRFIGYSVAAVIAYAFFLSALVVITFIDLEHQIIPDGITLPGIPIAILLGATILPDPFSRAHPLGLQSSLVGFAAGGGLFYLIAVAGESIFRKQAMGGGDIKLMALVGGLLGWKSVIVTTFVGSLIGSAVGLLLIVLKGRKWGSRLPFGPFLAVGSAVSLFWGQELFLWYLYGWQ